jgi:hypothetical protein
VGPAVSRVLYYRLEGDVVRPLGSEYGDLMKTNAGARVARDEFIVDGADVLVSTVFLAIDHNFGRDGEPVLFETMVFRGEEREQYRYSTLAQFPIHSPSQILP